MMDDENLREPPATKAPKAWPEGMPDGPLKDMLVKGIAKTLAAGKIKDRAELDEVIARMGVLIAPEKKRGFREKPAPKPKLTLETWNEGRPGMYPVDAYAVGILLGYGSNELADFLKLAVNDYSRRATTTYNNRYTPQELPTERGMRDTVNGALVFVKMENRQHGDAAFEVEDDDDLRPTRYTKKTTPPATQASVEEVMKPRRTPLPFQELPSPVQEQPKPVKPKAPPVPRAPKSAPLANIPPVIREVRPPAAPDYDTTKPWAYESVTTRQRVLDELEQARESLQAAHDDQKSARSFAFKNDYAQSLIREMEVRYRAVPPVVEALQLLRHRQGAGYNIQIRRIKDEYDYIAPPPESVKPATRAVEIGTRWSYDDVMPRELVVYQLEYAYDKVQAAIIAENNASSGDYAIRKANEEAIGFILQVETNARPIPKVMEALQSLRQRHFGQFTALLAEIRGDKQTVISPPEPEAPVTYQAEAVLATAEAAGMHAPAAIVEAQTPAATAVYESEAALHVVETPAVVSTLRVSDETGMEKPAADIEAAPVHASADEETIAAEATVFKVAPRVRKPKAQTVEPAHDDTPNLTITPPVAVDLVAATSQIKPARVNKRKAHGIEPAVVSPQTKAALDHCFADENPSIDTGAMEVERAVEVGKFFKALRVARGQDSYIELARTLAQHNAGYASEEFDNLISAMSISERELGEPLSDAARNRTYRKHTNPELAQAIADYAYPPEAEQRSGANKRCVEFLSSKIYVTRKAKYRSNMVRESEGEEIGVNASGFKPAAIGKFRKPGGVADLLADAYTARDAMNGFDPAQAEKISIDLYKALTVQLSNGDLERASVGTLNGEETSLNSATISRWRTGRKEGDVKILVEVDHDKLLTVCDALAHSIAPDAATAEKLANLMAGVPWEGKKTNAQIVDYAVEHKLDGAALLQLQRRQLRMKNSEHSKYLGIDATRYYEIINPDSKKTAKTLSIGDFERLVERQGLNDETNAALPDLKRHAQYRKLILHKPIDDFDAGQQELISYCKQAATLPPTQLLTGLLKKLHELHGTRNADDLAEAIGSYEEQRNGARAPHQQRQLKLDIRKAIDGEPVIIHDDLLAWVAGFALPGREHETARQPLLKALTGRHSAVSKTGAYTDLVAKKSAASSLA